MIADSIRGTCGDDIPACRIDKEGSRLVVYRILGSRASPTLASVSLGFSIKDAHSHLGFYFLFLLQPFSRVRPRAKEEEFCLLYVTAAYNLTHCSATIWVNALAS